VVADCPAAVCAVADCNDSEPRITHNAAAAVRETGFSGEAAQRWTILREEFLGGVVCIARFSREYTYHRLTGMETHLNKSVSKKAVAASKMI
jgi:hypothetical protein